MSKIRPKVNLQTGAPLADGEEAGDGKRGIQSVEVGYGLLRVLSASRAKMPLKTLAEQAGMSPSKAYLYLVSYMRIGLVSQDPITSRYGLGSTAIQLGMAALNQLDLVEVARGPMNAVHEATGLAVALSIWGNRGPTIIYRIDGELPIPMSVQVGYVLPLLSTATGRTFMSFQPRPVWSNLAEEEGRRLPDKLERALAALESIRATRTAVTKDENETGFFGVASPVIDGTGRLRAVMTALGVSKGADLSSDAPFATAVHRAASQVSAALGDAA